jgi:hypothetical protein
VLVSQRGSLLSATARLGRISTVWLALALGAETVSFLAAAELQHHLLAGVLVYRLVSIWLVLPAGWLAWTCLKRREAQLGEPAQLSEPSSQPAAA